MAYDQYLAERIERVLSERKALFYQKKMMGGLVFMVDDKMCIGIARDKKTQEDRIMARIGEEAQVKNEKRLGCRPMEFTGRPMKDFVFIYPEGYDNEEDLEFWVDLALAFNPKAKKSKGR
ncbi:TfoX/Sxy family protein [Algoriphagus namhaensis]|uniref:TfoX/Sxy family protein n=1 Tax=Algoriphagus namhaensis TaxID=915353 RepID=A0ABV8AQ65_9BACT